IVLLLSRLFSDQINQAIANGVIEIGCKRTFIRLVFLICIPHRNKPFLEKLLMRIAQTSSMNMIVHTSIILLGYFLKSQLRLFLHFNSSLIHLYLYYYYRFYFVLRWHLFEN